MNSGNTVEEQIQQYYEDFYLFDDPYFRWVAQFGTSKKVVFIMEKIYEGEGHCRSQKYICDRMSFPKQTVSAALNRLERDGLIRREADPEDSRGKLVYLTSKGEEWVKEVILPMREREVRGFESLTAEQRETMCEGLHLLAAALQKGFEDVAAP